MFDELQEFSISCYHT